MPTNTSPDNIPKPASSDPVAPLEGWFQGQADATQAGLSKRTILTYANAAAFPAANTVPLRFAIDLSNNWLFLSNGTKWLGVVPLTDHPIDGVTTNATAVTQRRNRYLNEYIQSGDPGQDPGRKWVKTP